MGDEFGILIGLVVLGYLFLSPLVLIILYRQQRKTVRWLEDELIILKQSFQDYRERMAKTSPPDGSPVPDQRDSQESEKEIPERPFVEPVSSALDADSRDPAIVPTKEMEPVPEPVEVPAIAPSLAREQEVETVGPGERFCVFLQGIGMWPPSRQAGIDRETVLMQWWLPRVGGLLALLSALFFGVYINQNTSPLFKCIELLLVSVGVTGLGWFMERRYKAFGGILLATGLIMVYLTSVAAYALPATRVISNPMIGSIVQGVILVAICLIAIMRQSRGLVLLTFHFGYFLGLFMVHEGLREGALLEAGLLFIAGMLLVRKALYRQLAWVVIAGSYLIVLAFPVLNVVTPIDLPREWTVQLYICLVFAGISTAYYGGLLDTGRPAKLMLSLGSSLAIASTLLFFREFYVDDLEWGCLALGMVMLAAALIGWIRKGCGFAVQLLFIKSSFLIGVWAILHFAGDLRWMVLALQTVVVALAARRARVVALEVLVWAVALVSLLYYVDAIGGSIGHGTFVWWMMVVYPLVITLSFSLLLKGFREADWKDKTFSRIWIYAFVPLLATALWNDMFETTAQRSFDMALPFICLVYIAALLSLIPIFSWWMLFQLAALSFVTGVIHFCDEPFSIIQLSGIVIAAAGALHFVSRRPEKWAEIAESGIYFLTILPVTLWTLQLMDNWLGQAIVVFLLCASIVLSGLIPLVRQAGSWGFLPLLVYVLTESPSAGAGGLNLIALAAGFGWLVVPALLPAVKKGMGWASKNDAWVIISGLLFWIYVQAFGDPEATWMAGQWVLEVLAILFLLACFKWKVHGYLLAAVLFAMTATLRHSAAMYLELSYVPWIKEALVSAGLLYAFSLLWFFLKPEPFPNQPESTQNRIRSVSTAASAILLFVISVVTFQYRELGWMAWYTPLLAITAFVMILLGLFYRDTIYRRLGLVALLVPLVRLFLVDVQDVLHRIIAFAASAVLLTLLGYLYHRLSAQLNTHKE